jgi:hypothetical protein
VPNVLQSTFSVANGRASALLMRSVRPSGGRTSAGWQDERANTGDTAWRQRPQPRLLQRRAAAAEHAAPPRGAEPGDPPGLQAQLDRLARQLAGQERAHAAALAELRRDLAQRAQLQHPQLDAAVREALAAHLHDAEARVASKLAERVEQLHAAAESAVTKCGDLSRGLSACEQRLDAVDSRVERQLAASASEASGVRGRLQAELDAAAAERGRIDESGAVLASLSASVGQFERQALAAHQLEPEPEPEPELVRPLIPAAMAAVVGSLEVEVAAQAKRLDALSLELATRGQEAAASSRLAGQRARSLALRVAEGSETGTASVVGGGGGGGISQESPALRRSVRTLETRLGELESRTNTALFMYSRDAKPTQQAANRSIPDLSIMDEDISVFSSAAEQEGWPFANMQSMVEATVSEQLAKDSAQKSDADEESWAQESQEMSMRLGHKISRLESNLNAVTVRDSSVRLALLLFLLPTCPLV